MTRRNDPTNNSIEDVIYYLGSSLAVINNRHADAFELLHLLGYFNNEDI